MMSYVLIQRIFAYIVTMTPSAGRPSAEWIDSALYVQTQYCITSV